MKLAPGITDKRIINNFNTLEERFEKVHGGKYNYDNVLFKRAIDKVVINCPEHGNFHQAPTEHLKGAGCPVCAIEEKAKQATLNTEQFIERSIQKHGDKYDYTKSVYKGSRVKLTITCPIHGDFKQTPGEHMNKGYGCKECGNIAQASTRTNTTEEFIMKANKVHRGLYSYSKTKYTNSKTKVLIDCATHGTFSMRPNDHLNGQNCQMCTGSRGFQRDLKAYLYYLKVTTTEGLCLYKIGITNKSVAQRYNITDLKNIEVLQTIEYSVGQDAYDEEQRILKKYKEYKYSGPTVLESGNTELFTKDVLNVLE